MKNHSITLANLSGGEILSGLSLLLKALPKDEKKIIVELPCVGWPRVAYTLEQVGEIQKEQTVDQLLMDLDREQAKPVEEYVIHRSGVDYLIIDPRSQPESPVVRKLGSNETLIAVPTYLRQQLAEHYDWIIFVTQGMLIHPMTHFAVRSADATVLYSATPMDVVGNFTHYKRLLEVFGAEAERLVLFSADSRVKLDAPLEIRFSDVVKKWTRDSWTPKIHPDKRPVLPVGKDKETVGIIEPKEYLAYQVPVIKTGNELSASDAKKFEQLLLSVRHRLQDKHMDEYIQSLTKETARQKVRYYIADFVREQTELVFSIPLAEVIEWVQREITELGVLQEILDESRISSIEVNDIDQVIVEKDGKDIHLPDIRFQSRQHLYEAINKILMPIGKPISSSEPIIDANYRGFRVSVVADTEGFQGVSANAPLISIRKFPPRVFSNEECIAYGNLSAEIVDFMSFVVPIGAAILIGGGTNSGKTTQLIRLPLFVPKITRIISIEDSEEMMLASKEQYQDYPNLPSLLVKEVGDEKKSIGIGKLIRACLRLRPEVLLIGEIRDEPAAQQALIAANTGHVLWASTHSNSAAASAIRFLQLNGNTTAAASQIASTLDLILFQKRMPGGVRVVTEISELVGYQGTETPILNPIFKYHAKSKTHVRVGKIQSQSLLEKILMQDPAEEMLEKWCDMEELKKL